VRGLRRTDLTEHCFRASQRGGSYAASYAVDEASSHFFCRLKERISYFRRVLEFSQSVDSEVDGRMWVQARPFLNAIGGCTFEQQTFETNFFEGIGQCLRLPNDYG